MRYLSCGTRGQARHRRLRLLDAGHIGGTSARDLPETWRTAEISARPDGMPTTSVKVRDTPAQDPAYRPSSPLGSLPGTERSLRFLVRSCAGRATTKIASMTPRSRSSASGKRCCGQDRRWRGWSSAGIYPAWPAPGALVAARVNCQMTMLNPISDTTSPARLIRSPAVISRLRHREPGEGKGHVHFVRRRYNLGAERDLGATAVALRLAISLPPISRTGDAAMPPLPASTQTPNAGAPVMLAA